MNPLAFTDASQRRYVAELEQRLAQVEQRLDRLASPDGALIAHLPQGTKKATSSGDKELTAGEVTELDSLADVPDDPGGTWRKVAGVNASNRSTSTSLESNSVTNPKVASSAVTNDKVNDVGAVKVTEDGSREFVHPSYTDASRRPTKLRRSGADLGADDVSRQDEVQEHIGGQGNANVRDGNTTVVDVDNREYELGTVLNSVQIATSNSEPAGFIRAGAVRAINALNNNYKVVSVAEEGLIGISDGVSTFGMSVPGDGNAIEADSGTGGGGGTGQGGDPIEP